MHDERLSQSVRLQEPSIALGDFAELLREQTGVSLRVAQAWQKTRVMVYAPDVSLRDLMTALTEALPMLEWRVLRSAPDAPPEYLLQARRADPPRPTERTLVQRIQAIRLVLPFYPFRLREFMPYRSPYHDAFVIGRGATAVDPQVAWDFYVNLTPQQQARLKAGSEVRFQELDGAQQQRFLALLIGERPSLGWERETKLGDLLLENMVAYSTPSAQLRMERARTVIREPNPNARRRILQSENQFYALTEYLQDEEAYSVERERFSERWVLQLRCGDLTVEWELAERTPSIDWLWEE